MLRRVMPRRKANRSVEGPEIRLVGSKSVVEWWQWATSFLSRLSISPTPEVRPHSAHLQPSEKGTTHLFARLSAGLVAGSSIEYTVWFAVNTSNAFFAGINRAVSGI